VKLDELELVAPFNDTEILPVVAPDGTVVVIRVDVIDVTVAAAPLNFTIRTTEVASAGFKLVPVMTTVVPTGPDAGLKETIEGSGRILPVLQENRPMQSKL